ncbi:MAG: TetR family transcriptional regulator C-terminal domain-containing protein [Owenweeksia sp.]
MDQDTVTSETAHNTDVKTKIIEAYKEYVLLKGTEPPSIFAFCKELEISEAEFYEHFNSFGQVAAAFWSGLFSQITNEIRSEEAYADYEVKEKLLTFYFAFFEALKPHRSFALLSFKDSVSLLKRESQHLSTLKKDFKLWAGELINEGMRNGEIAQRLKITGTYDNILWLQFMFLLNFWRKDGSHGFERTDAAIEKSVRFGFDLMEKNALDSAFDFGRFLFQDR